VVAAEKLSVISNERVDSKHFVISFKKTAAFATINPGQFVQLETSTSMDPLLFRPFSIFDETSTSFSCLYRIEGKGTTALSTIRSEELVSVIGPLGNGFSLDNAAQVTMIAGGVGIAPMYHLAKYCLINHIKVTLIYGARSAEDLVTLSEFKAIGIKIHIATEDGSLGQKGYVTNCMTEKQQGVVVACGPTAMLKAVSAVGQKNGYDVQVSLEAPMACGFGVCLGCVVKDKQNSYRKVCKEGPVFKGSELW
jgi:dihydroorotate dehydrogenase electron transfer subunit